MIGVKELPLSQRRSICSLATGLGVSTGFIQSILPDNDGSLQSHTSAVESKLTEENKLAK